MKKSTLLQAAVLAALALSPLQSCCDDYFLPEKGSYASTDHEFVRTIVATDNFETITETYELGNHIYTVRYLRVD